MHDVDAKAIDPLCPVCQGVLREGALFCSNCGYCGTASPVIPSRVELQSSTTNFDSHWGEIKQVGWLFGLLLFSSLILGMTARSIPSPWPEAIASGIDAVIVLMFASLRYRDTLSLLVLPKLSVRSALELLGVVLTFIAIMGAYFALIQRAGVPVFHIATKFKQFDWPIWSMFFLVSAMPAIFEELAFRGVIQSALERVLGEREAWIIQAALFSVLHLLPMMFLSHFAMGLCLGYMRRQSKSLYPGMILHAGWNALVLYQELYSS